MSIRSKQDLGRELAKLKSFQEQSMQLEQYATPSSIAADWIWQMALKGEIANKIILDAASGPGILGIACLLMGAKHVIFLDKDQSAMQICIDNYNQIFEEFEIGTAEFIIEDISLFDAEVDIVIQNPPFGTKEKHIDKKFLETAFSITRVIYSMHKYSTQRFVEAITKDNQFTISHVWRYEFPIKAVHSYHTKPVKKIDVGLWRLEKST
jgi:putative methylase